MDTEYSIKMETQSNFAIFSNKELPEVICLRHVMRLKYPTMQQC